ncbi:MAG TPA: biopolymer transporter ExbD [Burkholderiaceae bacterium]|nr:biopolymer transporter ExbD [Burkholderiaceae bacterium]
MNFRPGHRDEPELNLIPFIDILLVVLIFLVLTTTYSKYTELQVNLPVADAEAQKTQPNEVLVTIARDSRIAVNGTMLANGSVGALSEALAEAGKADNEAIIVISADAAAPHQAVVSVMDAARRTGLGRISFTTQSSSDSRNARRP